MLLNIDIRFFFIFTLLFLIMLPFFSSEFFLLSSIFLNLSFGLLGLFISLFEWKGIHLSVIIGQYLEGLMIIIIGINYCKFSFWLFYLNGRLYGVYWVQLLWRLIMLWILLRILRGYCQGRGYTRGLIWTNRGCKSRLIWRYDLILKLSAVLIRWVLWVNHLLVYWLHRRIWLGLELATELPRHNPIWFYWLTVWSLLILNIVLSWMIIRWKHLHSLIELLLV